MARKFFLKDSATGKVVELSAGVYGRVWFQKNFGFLDDSISATHFEILERDHKFYLHDLKSSNGCFWQGHRVQSHEEVPLNEEGQLQVAERVFQVLVTSEQTTKPKLRNLKLLQRKYLFLVTLVGLIVAAGVYFVPYAWIHPWLPRAAREWIYQNQDKPSYYHPIYQNTLHLKNSKGEVLLSSKTLIAGPDGENLVPKAILNDWAINSSLNLELETLESKYKVKEVVGCFDESPSSLCLLKIPEKPYFWWEYEAASDEAVQSVGSDEELGKLYFSQDNIPVAILSLPRFYGPQIQKDVITRLPEGKSDSWATQPLVREPKRAIENILLQGRERWSNFQSRLPLWIASSAVSNDRPFQDILFSGSRYKVISYVPNMLQSCQRLLDKVKSISQLECEQTIPYFKWVVRKIHYPGSFESFIKTKTDLIYKKIYPSPNSEMPSVLQWIKVDPKQGLFLQHGVTFKKDIEIYEAISITSRPWLQADKFFFPVLYMENLRIKEK